MKTLFQQYVTVIPAGKSIKIPVKGNFYWVAVAVQQLQIRLDEAQKFAPVIPMRLFECYPGEEYSYLEFKCPGAVDCALTFWYGFGRVTQLS